MNINPMEDPGSTESPSAIDPSHWMDAFTPARLVGLLAIFLFGLYPGVVLGTHSFFLRDFGLFTYPVAYFAHESFWHGEVPLWNPLNYCGIPFLAQWNTSVCYPLSLIYLVFPLPWSLNYFCLGHLFLAGVGMYWLAFRWTQNRLAASVAGLVFALNGLMLNNLMWTSNLAALSWQPLVTLWAEQAWRTGGSRRVAIAALAGAMQMLAGAPEIVVFTWILLGLLWLTQIECQKILFWATLRRFVIIVVLIAALAAIQLFPFFDLLKHSERNAAFASADDWPMPIWGWADFLVPVFHCVRTVFGNWQQASQPWTSSYYLGVGTLSLAALAVWRLRQQLRIWSLVGMTLGGLVLALGNGGHVYTWLKHIAPCIGFARFPIKFVSIPIFTIPLLAAFGVNCFQRATAQNPKRDEHLLHLIVAVLLLTTMGILAMARWSLAPMYRWQLTWSNGAWRVIFLIALVGALSAMTRVKTSRLRGLMGLAALTLIGLDLVTAGLRENPTIVTKAFGPLALNMSFRPQYGQSRAMISQQVQTNLYLPWTDNPIYYFGGLREALWQNSNIPENIPKLDGFYSLHLTYEWDIDGLFYGFYPDLPAQNITPAPLLDFLGVSQVSATNTVFAWETRKSFLPLATAGQRPIFADAAETLKRLDRADFDPQHEVYLPSFMLGKLNVSNASNARIVSQQFSAQGAHLQIEAPAPALVVIAQAYYHDWHAFVDGRPVPLLRANLAFQALQVPAGQHEIALHYEDWMFRIGAVISALALLGCMIGLFSRPKT